MKQLVRQLGLRDDFCPGCLDITPDNVHKNWFSYHRICVSDLSISAESGCTTCSIIYRGLLAATAGRVTRDQQVKILIEKEQIKVFLAAEGQEYLLRARPGHVKQWKTLMHAPSQWASLGSEESFAVMRSWIKRCETSHPHEECTSSFETLLPRRLVYIYPNSSSDNHQTTVLSLQEPPVGTTGKYIALSHCWGTEPVLRTTKANLSQLRSRINFSELPLTFRDAVHCTQRLGISYLWIDSLCIIQDDLQDWDVESGKMASIYHDAYLVIAAGASISDHGGLLYERPHLIQGMPLESQEGSGVFDLVVQEEVPHAIGLFPSAMVDSPITSRAWCMQELILARRSISFFKEELVWECHSCLDCECGKITSSSHNSHKTDLGNFDVTALWFGWDNQLFRDSFKVVYKWKPYTFFPNRGAIFNEWRHLTVPAYSARKLSKLKDRLPAAAGIASLIATRYGQEYLAGIWREDLKCGLMWSVPPSQRLAPAPDEYIAPSFSWASVNSEVTYACPIPEMYDLVKSDGKATETWDLQLAYGFVECHLAEANLKPSGANPLGCVEMGSYIRIYGQSMRLKLRLKGGVYSISHTERVGRGACSLRRPGGSLVFHPDCVLKEVHTIQPPEERTFVQAAIDYWAGSTRPVKLTKSVNRSKTGLDVGMSDDFETEVDALVLTDVRKVYEEWFSNCCAFILLGVSQTYPDSHERLGLGTWRFGDDEVDGQWTEHTNYCHFKIV